MPIRRPEGPARVPPTHFRMAASEAHKVQTDSSQKERAMRPTLFDGAGTTRHRPVTFGRRRRRDFVVRLIGSGPCAL